MSQIEPNVSSNEGAQSINKPAKKGWLRNNFWGLVTLAAVTIICVIIVQTFKKPGQMSVIESQAMDMTAMVPPKGAVPVGIAKVERRSIDGSVTYTGTVQAFSDEDIYPRITGRITSMPVYAGDRVKKGQLLVQLDAAGNSEYSVKREEAESAESAAMHNAGIAKLEFQQKKYEVEAAQEAELSTKKTVEEAEASAAYWKPELERQSALLKAQVVSLDEYQKEVAEAKAAEAKVAQAKAKVREATKTRLAAQAQLEAMMHHVGHQSSAARQAEATLKGARISESYTRILAQDDGVVTKRLISPGVVVSPGMLLLKIAHIKRVRIQAQVATEDAQKIDAGDQVYIQGSDDDKEPIRAFVTAVFPAADPASRTFTVESLIENARATNAGSYKFLPGQYVVMRIVTGQHEALTVPTSAVVLRGGTSQVWKAVGGSDNATKAQQYTCVMHPEVTSDKPGKCPKCGMDLVPKDLGQPSKKEYTCVMHPEVISDKPGKCPKCLMDLVPKDLGGKKVAQLVDVQVGLSNQDRTEIVSGLAEGDEVIFAGYANLQPETPIVATEWGASGPTKLPLASDLSGNRLDGSNSFTYKQMAGQFNFKISMAPAKGGSNSLLVKVEKSSGGGVSGAQVSIKTSMPGMNMPGPDLGGRTNGDGDVSFKSDFMSGLWQLNVSIKAPGAEPVETVLDVEVP